MAERTEISEELRGIRIVGAIRTVVGIILAVAIGLFIYSYIARDDLITGCKRNSYFKALAADGWHSASITRARQPGAENHAAAIQYELIARGMLEAIPAPLHDYRLAEVYRSGDHYVLSHVSTQYQMKGCDNAYQPLISGID